MPRNDHDWWIGLGLWIFVFGIGPVHAQDEVRNFKMPILMVETGSHHARVRSLLWQDDATLLSGGEDKVVKVWDFREDEPRLARSIRPMIWRGPAGIIYAMAVSSRPDAQGQSFLAVAGYGIEARRGDITIFRIPGLVRTPAGEVVTRLMPPPDGQPQAKGHVDVVTCLAFSPDGKLLASGSNDTTIILWDVPAFRPRAVLRGHTLAVRTIAFNPDGTRLASGGADGSLFIWDVAQGVQVDSRAGNANRPNPVNTLAYSPDRQWLVVGFENPGQLGRLQAANIRQGDVLLPFGPTQGPVECVAFHPDAKKPRLAVSIKSDRSEVPDAVGMSCDVEIRDMPAGKKIHYRRVSGLVYALAFSRDGRKLAYAGGTDQAIQVVDPAAPNQPAREIRGSGSTPFDLRFSQDSKIIGFTRVFDRANPPASYEGFDLERHESRTVARNDLPRGEIRAYQGWRLQPSSNAAGMEAVDANGQSRAFPINQALERNAWSSTIIPPGTGHPRATVAIGTESGVAVFDFESGERKRVYAGHSSPVVSLAPSPDGRWLASGSMDQTVMLYPLDGCDARALLGFTYGPRLDRVLRILSVEPKSFAAAMGLLPGDVLVRVGIGWGEDNKRFYNTPQEIEGFFGQLPGLDPYLYMIGIKVRRTLMIPTIGLITYETELPTTRRNNPALVLFLGTDREWLFWTPQGYYDTSIEGDARFLGWHINPPFRTTRPTDFVPIGTFAETMNRRDVVDRVWRTGVLDLAAAVPAPAPVRAPAAAPAPAPIAAPPTVVVAENQPPRIVFASVQGGTELPAPWLPWTVDRPNPQITIRIAAAGKSPIRRRRIILDERPITRDPNVEPVGELNEVVPLNGLPPNRRVRLAVEAANEGGSQRTETIDLVYVPVANPPKPAEPPPPAPAPPRLHLLTIGCDQFAGGLPPIEFASHDAKSLAYWLADHLTSAAGTKSTVKAPQVLAGPAASVASITAACDHILELVENKQVNDHDVMAVVIASHILPSKEGTVIAAADTVGGSLPRPAVAAADLCELLGRLTDYGCRVVVFLDGVHKLEEPLKSEIKPFVRDLQRKRHVITFIASKEGPSRVDRIQQNGIFAIGVMQAFRGADLAGARTDRSGAYTLDQFRTAVENEVLNLSGRRQRASCYIPTAVSEKSLFARPR
jgi:WD40 repeat protein